MATYKQVIPEFVNHGPSDLITGELEEHAFGEIFLTPFIIRHLEVDPDALMHFSLTKGVTNIDMRGNDGYMYSIWIDYPNHPKMSHVIGHLTVSAEENTTNWRFLATPHPLMMQKLYSYLHETEVKKGKRK